MVELWTSVSMLTKRATGGTSTTADLLKMSQVFQSLLFLLCSLLMPSAHEAHEHLPLSRTCCKHHKPEEIRSANRSLRRGIFDPAGSPLTSRSAGSFVGALGCLSDARSQTRWAQPSVHQGSATTVVRRLVRKGGNIEGPKQEL